MPFSSGSLLIDIAKELDLAVLVVAANRLGAINHTLLTIEAIERRGMTIIGLIFNNCYKGVDRIILRDNPKIIKSLSGVTVLGTLPLVKNIASLSGAFSPIGDKIFHHFTPRRCKKFTPTRCKGGLI